MGVRLVHGLIEAGWKVRALVLPKDPLRSRLEDLACELREGDVAEPRSLSGLCDDIDTVYHLAAVILSYDPDVFRRVNLEGTTNMVSVAVAGGVRHFVYVSSASVTYPRRTPYAESKLAAERVVLQEPALMHTIVRPTLAYDENGGQEFLMFLKYLERFPVVPFIGAGEAVKRPVWAADIVDGLLRVAGNPVAYGKTYNFSGGEPISMIAFARLVLRHHGGERPIVRVPVVAFRALAGAMRATMRRPPLTSSAIEGVVNDADLDPAAAMRDLGYAPLGVRDGFRRCFPIARHPVEGSVPNEAPSQSTSRLGHTFVKGDVIASRESPARSRQQPASQGTTNFSQSEGNPR
jgi:nucleoside-diphosphate-sugar epimerase